jgi:hypothetical protein
MTFIPQPTSSTSSHGMVAGGAAAYEQEMFDGVFIMF